jgi:hypothetical protein
MNSCHKQNVGFHSKKEVKRRTLNFDELPVSERIEGVTDPTENWLECPGGGCQVIESGIFEIRFLEIVFDVIEVRVECKEQYSRVEGHHVVHSLVVSIGRLVMKLFSLPFSFLTSFDFNSNLFLCHRNS